MLLVACTVLFLHFVLGSITCGWDTSYCAESRDKNTMYVGELVTEDGRVLADTPFTVRFESRNDEPVSGYRTNADGMACVLWTDEAVSPNAYVDGELVARLEVPGEDDAVDPATCQTSDASIPWNRTREITETPQFLSAFVPGLLAILVLLIGVFRPTRTLFALGSILTATTFVLLTVIWFT